MVHIENLIAFRGRINMTYLQAAILVLEKSDTPLTAREIYDQAMARGLLQPSGKTPVASLSAALYTHAQDGRNQWLERVYKPGEKRALRGSVRWQLRNRDR